MENTQDFLNVLTITLVLAFVSLIILDLFTGLVDLWNQLDNHEIKVQHQLPHKLETRRNVTLPYLKIANEVVKNISSCADIAANNVNTEALALLIQKLPQSRIRTAARRLGIADRVDGKYQKLGVLRMQLKGKLESQPMEVAQVLKGLETA
ncbi:hypothetical protein [Brunnivagina elsteri]|uniref:Uncharacterized protein n=1 Tax=Brunnivagina elsteri CCALA 953 TaxID=987040 RepID=A0A2A2TK54_9CYAN|nr:hypothetical protein [Calothrix elsteri]PAX56123.1 hypothetical protein CK510_10650 [Calothrix elsteri CCALA 953]